MGSLLRLIIISIINNEKVSKHASNRRRPLLKPLPRLTIHLRSQTRGYLLLSIEFRELTDIDSHTAANKTGSDNSWQGGGDLCYTPDAQEMAIGCGGDGLTYTLVLKVYKSLLRDGSDSEFRYRKLRLSRCTSSHVIFVKTFFQLSLRSIHDLENQFERWSFAGGGGLKKHEICVRFMRILLR